MNRKVPTEANMKQLDLLQILIPHLRIYSDLMNNPLQEEIILWKIKDNKH